MIAEKINKPNSVRAISLASVVEGPFKPRRKGFWKFMKDLFLAPDLDLKQFERLEAKRTRHQIELERFY